MRYSDSYITINNKQVKQINKTTALKLFNKGETIFLHPSNMSLNNSWQSPFNINLDKSEPLEKYNSYAKKNISQFNVILNEFEYYNCCSELGKYANFFIQINN